MTEARILENVLERDRLLVLGSLVGVTALAWIYLFILAADMGDMEIGSAMGSGMAMAQAKPWSVLDFALIFLMWAVMMVGMMLPSATPMILLYATVTRKQQRAFISSRRSRRPVSNIAAHPSALWCATGVPALGEPW